MDRTPNDLAWEALTSSAPFLTQYTGNVSDEPIFAEAGTWQPDTEETATDGLGGLDEFDPIVEEQVPREVPSQQEAPEEMSSDESGCGNGKN